MTHYLVELALRDFGLNTNIVKRMPKNEIIKYVDDNWICIQVNVSKYIILNNIDNLPYLGNKKFLHSGKKVRFNNFIMYHYYNV